MDIAVVGDGPGAEAAKTGLEDVDANVFAVEASLLDGFDSAVVIGTAGDDVFEAANDALDRWVAVEIGGLGGVPLADVDAAVTLFDLACYECLCTRVAAGSAEPADKPRGVRSAVRYAGATAARRLIRDLAGDGLSDTVLEEPGRERQLLPVPECECTTRDEPTIETTDRRLPAPPSDNDDEHDETAWADARPSLEDALGRAERAVDDRIGPLTQVGERESFPIPYYVASTADTTEFSDARAAEFSGGAAVDWNRAFMKALGEGMERYCAGVYRAAGFEETTAESLRSDPDVAGPVVAPKEFVAPEEFDDDPDAPRPWVRGTTLTSDRTDASAWLPAEAVFYPAVERRIRPAITTGLGLGNSVPEAALSGLYEVIERDATMLAWYSTFEPLALSFDGELSDLRKRAHAEELDVTTLLVTQDIDVPVVAAAVHRDATAVGSGTAPDDEQWPAFAAGSGAALDPVSAARSAVAEALQNWTELRAMGPEAADRQGGAIGRYAEFPESVQQFVDADADVPAATLGEPELTGRGELEGVLDRLNAVGLEAYAARTTTRDVAAIGFEGVRVVVPEAQPLFTGDPFFGDRARTVPETMGFEPRLDREYHPFP